MSVQDFLFYVLGGLSILGGLGVVCLANPIYAALSLAVTMMSVGGLFFLMGAYFIAGVQLLVYAGAVMVLFVMVLMLFDLRREGATFSRGPLLTLLKMSAVGAVLGVVMGVASLSGGLTTAEVKLDETLGSTRDLALLLFQKYVFAFEAISLVLLVVIVGAVSLARSKGGTHA